MINRHEITKGCNDSAEKAAMYHHEATILLDLFGDEKGFAEHMNYAHFYNRLAILFRIQLLYNITLEEAAFYFLID